MLGAQLQLADGGLEPQESAMENRPGFLVPDCLAF
jgi:hypothetical protein